MRSVLLLILLALPGFSVAQGLEEIVVTASRANGSEMPGRALTRNGDFLLLQVRISNDTREEDAREDEIYRTLRNALNEAGRARDVEVSVVSEDDLVYPLTLDNYRIDLSPGNRPDTSAATISVKTPVPAGNPDAQALINRLRQFVEGVSVVGRTELEPIGDVEISVVAPNQYRNQIVALFADDVREVTSALGGSYRVFVEDIDRPVQWYRAGLLELALYIPYRYTVIPESITSIEIAEDY